MPYFYCPNCGKKARDNAAFCEYCGKPLRTHPASFVSPKPRNPVSFLQVLIGALVAFGLSIAALFILRAYDSALALRVMGTYPHLAVLTGHQAMFPVLIVSQCFGLIFFAALPLLIKKDPSAPFWIGTTFLVFLSIVCFFIARYRVFHITDDPVVIDLMKGFIPLHAAVFFILFGVLCMNAYRGSFLKAILLSLGLFVLFVVICLVLDQVFVVWLHFGCLGLSMAHLVSSLVVYMIVLILHLLHS